MIFDLLTYQDVYDRRIAYPGNIGIFGKHPIYTAVKFYEIEDGCYFEFTADGAMAKVFTRISFENILDLYGRDFVHAIKITYRANRGLHIRGDGFSANFPASVGFRVGTVLINSTMASTDDIDIMDESWNLNPDEVSTGFPARGDYLIIKEIEILLI